MDSLISIIIPVYNRAYCLSRCLDSVLDQTFTNWECILIDDGSTDETLSVCRHYVNRDSRFRVYSQPNGGVSAARNRGLEYALGEYVAFIDSDDWVENNYLQLLYESIGKNTMPICSLNEITLAGEIRDISVQNVLYRMDSNIADLFLDHLCDGLLSGPVCKLYDRSIIEAYRIRFPLGVSWGEDLIFNYTYYRYIDQFKGIPYSLYHVIKQKKSLTTEVEYYIFLTDVNQKLWDSVSNFILQKGIDDPRLDAHLNEYYMILICHQLEGSLSIHDRLSWKERYRRMKCILSGVDRIRLKKYCKKNNFKLRRGWRAWFIYIKLYALIFLFYEIKYVVRRH